GDPIDERDLPSRTVPSAERGVRPVQEQLEPDGEPQPGGRTDGADDHEHDPRDPGERRRLHDRVAAHPRGPAACGPAPGHGAHRVAPSASPPLPAPPRSLGGGGTLASLGAGGIPEAGAGGTRGLAAAVTGVTGAVPAQSSAASAAKRSAKPTPTVSADSKRSRTEPLRRSIRSRPDIAPQGMKLSTIMLPVRPTSCCIRTAAHS